MQEYIENNVKVKFRLDQRHRDTHMKHRDIHLVENITLSDDNFIDAMLFLNNSHLYLGALDSIQNDTFEVQLTDCGFKVKLKVSQF